MERESKCKERKEDRMLKIRKKIGANTNEKKNEGRKQTSRRKE
jgi:hypothetical protein